MRLLFYPILIILCWCTVNIQTPAVYRKPYINMPANLLLLAVGQNGSVTCHRLQMPHKRNAKRI